MIIFMILGSMLLFLLGVVLFYSFLMLLGSIIPVNAGFRSAMDGVPIFVSSNGIHTDFVLPAINHLFDWSAVVDVADFATPLTTQSYLGIGWGDRGFYLDIPTWADLDFKTAFNAMCLPSPTLMHVTSHGEAPPSSKQLARIQLTEDQYLYLCQYIVSYFRIRDGKVDLIPGASYTPDDHFYWALGSYHAFNTCNFWINRGLIKTGVRSALWSPTDRGIFFQLKKVREG